MMRTVSTPRCPTISIFIDTDTIGSRYDVPPILTDSATFSLLSADLMAPFGAERRI